MARGCPGSDSEEERHDRFRSERNSGSLNASKSLFSTGLQQSSKSRSPLRHLNSPPPRRDRRSPSDRSRSLSKRRSKERKKSKERRVSKEKLKRDNEANSERSTSKTKEARHSDDASTRRTESRRRSRSKGRRRSGSKEKKRKSKEIRKKHTESDKQKSDSFLERFERRRPSVENEVVDSTIIYRDSSPEHDSQSNSKKVQENKSHKKKKEKKKAGDTEEGELISEEENNCFGPALPPKLESEEEDGEVKDNSGSTEGPALPPGYNDNTTIGPTLPERLCSRKRSNSQEEGPIKIQRLTDGGDEVKDFQRAPLIGPTLPPREALPSVGKRDEALYGPALPPPQSAEPGIEYQEVENETQMQVGDDLMIGPLPKGMELDDRVQRILEERAQSLRKQLEYKNSAGDDDQRKVREDWMVELPDVKSSAAHLGLGPRKFRTRDGPDMSDRSSWTDIAGVKQTKLDKKEDTNKEETRRLEVAAKNAEMERKVKETSSNREKSLLELHQKELKKKKKKELETKGGKEERRPFSREIDLQANRFDEARTKSVINKAQFLNSRFASGESKYL